MIHTRSSYLKFGNSYFLSLSMFLLLPSSLLPALVRVSRTTDFKLYANSSTEWKDKQENNR
jgi:hypothetical protein